MDRISVERLGPVAKADVTFGNLTVLVGPQATGKSIFLETLKLALDAGAIHDTLRYYGIDWGNDAESFFELYYGDGMGELWTKHSSMSVDGKKVALPSYARAGNRVKAESLFFIPAQRVLSLRDGQTRPFTDYRAGDPFVVRDFSEKVHNLFNDLSRTAGPVFPRSNRFDAALRQPLTDALFGKTKLAIDQEKHQRRFVLQAPGGRPGNSLSYLVWSAGQREFVPLLLGLYWLIPPSATTKRKETEWVVIEELEMGLHPHAISAVMAMVFELLSRGYNVCLSTHSPHVLDVVWAIRFLQENRGTAADVRAIFDLPSKAATDRLGRNALKKELRSYYFARDGVVRDISTLDPGAVRAEEAGWGGLTDFSGHVGDIVAKVARRAEK